MMLLFINMQHNNFINCHMATFLSHGNPGLPQTTFPPPLGRHVASATRDIITTQIEV